MRGLRFHLWGKLWRAFRRPEQDGFVKHGFLSAAHIPFSGYPLVETGSADVSTLMTCAGKAAVEGRQGARNGKGPNHGIPRLTSKGSRDAKPQTQAARLWGPSVGSCHSDFRHPLIGVDRNERKAWLEALNHGRVAFVKELVPVLRYTFVVGWMGDLGFEPKKDLTPNGEDKRNTAKHAFGVPQV